MLEQLLQLRRKIDELELEFSTLAAAFAETDEYNIHGFYSQLDCVRHACGLRYGEAADRLCVGRNLNALAPAVQALTESRIAFGHLVKLARAYEALEGACHVEALLAEAEGCSVGAFHYVCEQARHAAKPDDVAEEQAEAAERRSLEVSHLQDGMVSIRGVFDGVSGAMIENALEPLAQRSGKDDRRRRPPRLADALVELAEGTNPHLMVTITAETLLGLDGTPGGELAYSPPIPLPTLERLRCDCTLHRVVMTERSVVIDVGRGQRLVTAVQRRALEARDQRCRWPRLHAAGDALHPAPRQAVVGGRRHLDQGVGDAVPPPPLARPRGRLARGLRERRRRHRGQARLPALELDPGPATLAA